MTTAVIRRLMSIQKKVLWTPAHLQCVILAGDDAGQSGNLDVAAKVRMEDVVTVARRMREQVAERDRRPGIAQLRRTVGIEAVEHLYVADNRQHVAHRLVETDAPCSTSCMAAAPVTALVIEAMRNTESAVIGSGLSTDRMPKAAL
jgi:hypothetical protein